MIHKYIPHTLTQPYTPERERGREKICSLSKYTQMFKK